MQGDTRTLVLENERPVSWNHYYSGEHWSKRNLEAKRVHCIVRSQLDPELDYFTGPVDIEVIVYYQGKAIDADNVAAKLYIDGLKGWWFEDDTPDYISSVTTKCIEGEPRVEIIVTQPGPSWKYICRCCDRCWPSKKILKSHEKKMGWYEEA